MRALKLIVNALLILIGLPVVIVGILGMALSPFQTVARATEPQEMMQVSDLMLSEAVEEHVQQTLAERATAAEQVAWSKAEGDAGSPEEAGQAEAEGAAKSPEEVGELDAAGQNEAAEDAENVGASNAIGAVEEVGSARATETENAVSSAGLSNSPEWQAEASQTGDAAGGSWYEDPAASGTPLQGGYYSSEQLRNAGLISDGGVNYTWYSERVLPGGGLNIEGRHVSDEGYVVDGQGRIVVASSDLPYGTELSVPFGSGIAVVLDTGCAPGIVDVYTNF